MSHVLGRGAAGIPLYDNFCGHISIRRAFAPGLVGQINMLDGGLGKLHRKMRGRFGDTVSCLCPIFSFTSSTDWRS